MISHLAVDSRRLFVCLFVCLLVCLLAYWLAYLFVCLLACLLVRSFFCLFVRLFVLPFVSSLSSCDRSCVDGCTNRWDDEQTVMDCYQASSYSVTHFLIYTCSLLAAMSVYLFYLSLCF